MAIHPQNKTQRHDHSLYVKQNKKYQAILATLIIAFVFVFAAVLSSIDLPTSRVWKDNVLLRMIVNTQEFIRENKQ